MSVGPIQILIVGIASDDFTGKILPDLRALDEKGFIKITDVLFAKKDIKGNILALNENELTSEEAARFGSIAGTLIGLGISEDDGSGKATRAGYFALAKNDFGSNLEEIAVVIEKIPKNSSFAVLLIEQLWTIELKDDITKAGGVLLAQGQVSPLSIANIGAIGAEIAAASNASEQR